MSVIAILEVRIVVGIGPIEFVLELGKRLGVPVGEFGGGISLFVGGAYWLSSMWI